MEEFNDSTERKKSMSKCSSELLGGGGVAGVGITQGEMNELSSYFILKVKAKN